MKLPIASKPRLLYGSVKVHPVLDKLAIELQQGEQCIQRYEFAGEAPEFRHHISIVVEEFKELLLDISRQDLENVADSLVDTIWVLCGFAIASGIDLDLVWEEVRRANMAKLGGPKRADGKQLKPEGWKPPDINGCLTRQESLHDRKEDV